MDPTSTDPHAALDVDRLILIVVGAHLRAETHDRPLAIALRDRVRQWQRTHGVEQPLDVVVCTDLWYLNDRDLQSRPTISIGNPSVNAASACFANRLPAVFVVEGVFEVQLDVELIDLQACAWGVNPPATAAAVEAFADRYLDAFLGSAHGLGQQA